MSRQFYLKKFGRFSEKPYLCTAFRKRRGVAQLVAHLVWDQVVARSSRVTPTKKQRKSLQVQKKVVPLQRKNKNGALDEWLSLWSAKPATAVRIRQAPPKRTLYHFRYSVFLLLSDAILGPLQSPAQLLHQHNHQFSEIAKCKNAKNFHILLIYSTLHSL